jgi:hypothetical protein
MFNPLGRAMRAVLLAFVVVLTPLLAASQTCGTDPNTAHNKIKYSTYFYSKPQDAAQCSMRVVNDRIVVADSISNPGVACPDMFSWKLFADVITQEFWKNWASDQETWPGVQCPNGDRACKQTTPLPMCRAGQKGTSCCDPDAASNPGYEDANYPFKSCPYFPGDHTEKGFELRLAMPPSKAHVPAFAAEPGFRELLMAFNEPGRDVRQTMAELVFRNKPMWDFTFRNNLYNQEGIIQVFINNSNNINQSANGGPPYRIDNASRVSTEIDYPIQAIMIKSNWVSEEDAKRLKITDDPPHVKMDIKGPYTDNNGTIWKKGRYWLVALHISSKDTPNWIWATFEHVANPGRCDFTGCNDSYGYSSADPEIGPGQANNYTAPHVKCDDLPLASFVFDNGNNYGSGPLASSLASVFHDLGIGAKDNDTGMPSSADKAWLNYRLKGSQVQFADSMGRPTHLANSITEGGFVSSSSCITCHARAGTAAVGTLPPALGVFVNELEDSGYQRSAHGLPVPDWYHHSGQPPTLNVLQTDFIWGFLSANCITDKCQPAAAAPLQMFEERLQKKLDAAPTVRERTDAH